MTDPREKQAAAEVQAGATVSAAATVVRPFDSMVADEIVRNLKVHPNLSQEAIVVTEDKVKLCLRDYFDRGDRARGWRTPAGILFALVTALVTTDFRDALWIKAAVWEALFYFLGFAALCWLIRSLFALTQAPRLNDVIKDLKQASKQAKIP